MTQKELSFADLNIGLADVYGQMGYGDSQPDAATAAETAAVVSEVSRWLRPRFCFHPLPGTLDSRQGTLTFATSDNGVSPDSLSLGETTLDVGKIIARQLQGSEAFALFVCTSGTEYERYQQELKRRGDLVTVFIADALGSVIAERCADQMEQALQQSIGKLGWRHTNRFSPGYCGWHVSQQQRLFSLFPQQNPCGVVLTDSSLMVPIKSVSGLIGLGPAVRRLDYTCNICNFAKCFKRRKPKS